MKNYTIDPPEVWENDPDRAEGSMPNVVYVSALNAVDADEIYQTFRDCDEHMAIVMTQTFLINGTPEDARKEVAACATPGMRAYRIRNSQEG